MYKCLDCGNTEEFYGYGVFTAYFNGKGEETGRDEKNSGARPETCCICDSENIQEF